MARVKSTNSYQWRIGNHEVRMGDTRFQKKKTFKNLEQVSVNVYVTNFPDSITTSDLWQLCTRHGAVSDVYIAQKRSKLGKRFAFVRFLKSKDYSRVVEDLNRVWIGNHHVFASWARFNRNVEVKQGAANQKDGQSEKGTNGNTQVTQPISKVSYASVLQGNTQATGTEKIEDVKKVNLVAGDLNIIDDDNRILLGQVKDARVIPHMYKLCKLEGFPEIVIKYVGGVWLWMEFMTVASCMMFQKNEGLMTYFMDVKLVNKSFILQERAVWVEIQGLPCYAWSLAAYKKVASLYGRVLFADEDIEEQLSRGKVCISTTQMDPIKDTPVVGIEGEEYTAHVSEIANWCPDILRDDVNSEGASNHDMEESEHNSEEFKEEGSTDKEEEEVDINQILFAEKATPNERIEKQEIQRNDEEGHEGMTERQLRNTVEVDATNTESQLRTIEDKHMAASVDSSNKTTDPPGFNGQQFHSPFQSSGDTDSEKCWSYRDPKGNVHGLFSLAQLRLWKDYFPSDLQIWSYYGNVKKTILLHNALTRQTKDAG